MTTAMENAKWAREKQIVVQEFIDGRRKLVSAVAGKGFPLAPGFLYEFETGLELDAKQKLSAVSYKILSDAVERDLKQAGIDYDISFKTASMAWEIEKQTLLEDWDRELAVIKQIWAGREDDLAQLAVQVSLRGVILMNAKTDIELQAEALRTQLAGVEDASIGYEVQLIRQKVLTAQRKLEVLPILQQIIAVEQQIITAEQGVLDKEWVLLDKEKEKIGYLGELVDQEVQVADKKESVLLPAMLQMVTESEALATATAAEMIVERQIMAQKVIDAEISVAKSEKQILITESQLATEGARLLLTDARINLENVRKQYQELQLEQRAAKYAAIKALNLTVHDEIMNQDQSTRSNWVNLKTETAVARLTQDKASSKKIADDSVGNTISIANIHAGGTTTEATISAAAKLTASLTHIIG